MEKKYILIIIVNFILKISNSYPCEEKDFKQIFSQCDLETNTRNISIILLSECENKKIEDEENILSIYSTLPVFNISCDEYCNEGEIMRFNPFENKIECEKCPENTYSSGRDFKIVNNWKKEHLKKFTVNCFAISEKETKKDDNCTSLLISNDKTMLMTGDLIGDYMKYYIQIIYFFNSKQSGRFILKYKQDSIFENNLINGEFKLYIDYELIIRENKKNSDWKIIYKDFNEGEHQIVMTYWYFKNNENMRLYIQNFEVINFDETSITCEKCIFSFSPQGSTNCFSCPENYFYNEISLKCEKCKDGEFSFPNSNFCRKKEKCNIYDKELIEIGNCVNGKKILKYKINTNYCIENDDLKLIEEELCDSNLNNYNNDNNDIKCVPGNVLINKFEFDFKSYLIKDFFNSYEGFISNGNEIYSYLYFSDSEETLIKKIQIISQSAYIEFDLDLNLDKDEIFTIKINQETKTYSNIKSIFTEKMNLNLGKNTIMLIFTKEKPKNKISVKIKGLKIYGSELSNSKKILVKCPQKYISSKDCKNCIICSNNEIPDEKQENCIKCFEGIAQLINNNYICSKCPSYTYYENEQCKLNEVLINDNNKLRFNLIPFKEYYQSLCSDQSGILCYEKSFIVISNDNKENISQRDLFFISIFQQSTINILDFTYEEEQNIFKKGQIFGLFTINKPSYNINSDIFSEQNVTFTNSKIKKNLGQFIKKVYFSENLNKNSITIEMEEGDICLNDPKRNYKSYINLICNKYEISSPILKKVIDNKCTFIFDWVSPYACKNCITQDLTHFERGVCKNGKREIIFNSNDFCLIFNASNIKYKGNNNINNSNDNILNSNLYDNIFGKRNLKIVDVNQNFLFDFDYIEKKVYIQKCSFIDNLDDSLKKYLIIIPIIYIVTFIGVIIYCKKYRKMLSEYEKISSEAKSEVESKNKNKDNIIEVTES